jgi:hypothetical protein
VHYDQLHTAPLTSTVLSGAELTQAGGIGMQQPLLTCGLLNAFAGPLKMLEAKPQMRFLAQLASSVGPASRLLTGKAVEPARTAELHRGLPQVFPVGSVPTLRHLLDGCRGAFGAARLGSSGAVIALWLRYVAAALQLRQVYCRAEDALAGALAAEVLTAMPSFDERHLYCSLA